MFTSSSSMLSEVVMIRELAWKPRCAVIMFVNSWAISTEDDSSAPEKIYPETVDPATPSTAEPELAVGW
jgi:hypothetical protein